MRGTLKYICIVLVLSVLIVVKTLQAQVNETIHSPFEKMLPALEHPDSANPAVIEDKKTIENSQVSPALNNITEGDQA
jgi:hypothetical protein